MSESEGEWKLVKADFVTAAIALRGSLPEHWHDDAVVNFDDAMKGAIAPAALPYKTAETLVAESRRRAQHLRFADNPWMVQQLWEAALRMLAASPALIQKERGGH